MRRFTYGNYSYDYKLIKQERKSIALTIQPDLGIVLKCPYRADNERIELFLKRKWFWMNKQLAFFKKVHRKQYVREYVSGESFLYLGRQYKLLVTRDTHERVKLLKGILEVHTTQPVRNGEHNKQLLDEWFKNRYTQVFQERFVEMQKKFDYEQMPDLVVRNMARRWGSFSKKEKIILNPKLIHASKDCIDYVIVHELCHLQHKDHQKHYWTLLNKKYPQWEKVKEKLELRYGMM